MGPGGRLGWPIGRALTRALLFSIICFSCFTQSLLAQTDEIQVYDAEINSPGHLSLESESNFAAIGRKRPEFAGGLVSDRTLNTGLEWAYGVTDWLELGVDLPSCSVTKKGELFFNGVRLRVQLVEPHAADRTFFYGINIESNYNAPHWEPTRFSSELRPIIGCHLGPIDILSNPILETDFRQWAHLDFAPCERVAYRFSKIWAVAVEHYADYGRIGAIEPVKREGQTLFAVVDFNGDPNSVEFGIGHGFTAASDSLVFKLSITHNF